MGLLDILIHRDRAGATPARAEASVMSGEQAQAARVRARRRLIGAMVLLGVGVIAFPLLFETQPRPIVVDIPIVIPPRDGAPPLALPAPRPAASALPAASAPRPATAALPAASAPRPATAALPAASAPRPATAALPAASAPRPATPAAPIASAPVVAAPAAAPAPHIKPSEPPAAPKPAVATAPAPKPVAEEKPKPAVEPPSKPPAATTAGRFVVQIGAFAEASAVRDVRSKAQKAGVATFTQVVETSDGKRTRVRVGPFASREEAEKAAAQVKAAGLPGSVMAL